MPIMWTDFENVVKHSSQFVRLLKIAKVPHDSESVSGCILTALFSLAMCKSVNKEAWMQICEEVWDAFEQAKKERNLKPEF